MARTPKTAAPAAAPPSKSANALIPWEDRLAEDAAIAAGMEANTGGGQFFSVRGGVLTFQSNPVPGNQMAVVILDHIFENVFYEEAFDPNTIMPPTCFAFGREELALAPHKTVVEHGSDQHGTCQGCPMNAWGTADAGRGKACRNTRRLGIVPAGTLTEAGRFEPFLDPEHFEKAPVGYLKLPVTSVKGFGSFVKQLAGALRRPPHGIFTKVGVVPDPRSQFKVLFEPLAKVPDGLLGIICQRREEVRSIIEFPYNLDVEAQAPAAAPTKGRGAAKAAPAAAKPPAKPPVKRRY